MAAFQGVDVSIRHCQAEQICPTGTKREDYGSPVPTLYPTRCSLEAPALCTRISTCIGSTPICACTAEMHVPEALGARSQCAGSTSLLPFRLT